MANYIFDTNIVSILGRDDYTGNKLLDKISNLSNSDEIYISILTLYELTYGLKNCKNSYQKDEIEQNINFVKKYFKIIPLDLKETEIFAKLKVLYKNITGITKKDAKKNDLDFLIASSAIAQDAILVSNDKLFKVLADNTNLKYENWIED